VEDEMDDAPLFKQINDLSDEEEALWERAGDGDGLDATQTGRLESIRVQLDQAYDLLHQRQARRAAGLDPADAAVRPADVVEGYEQ
jgi:Protein of unknown function (DUF2630)